MNVKISCLSQFLCLGFVISLPLAAASRSINKSNQWVQIADIESYDSLTQSWCISFLDSKGVEAAVDRTARTSVLLVSMNRARQAKAALSASAGRWGYKALVGKDGGLSIRPKGKFTTYRFGHSAETILGKRKARPEVSRILQVVTTTIRAEKLISDSWAPTTLSCRRRVVGWFGQVEEYGYDILLDLRISAENGTGFAEVTGQYRCASEHFVVVGMVRSKGGRSASRPGLQASRVPLTQLACPSNSRTHD